MPGRKVSLFTVRQKTLELQREYMRLYNDDEIQNMAKEDVHKEFERLDYPYQKKSLEDLQNILKLFQRQRHMIFWHDGSCISNHSHLLMTVSVLYDQAVFYTDQEYYDKTSKHGFFRDF